MMIGNFGDCLGGAGVVDLTCAIGLLAAQVRIQKNLRGGIAKRDQRDAERVFLIGY